MSAGSGSDDMRELRRQRDEAERQRDALRESEGRWQDIARAEHLEVERLRVELTKEMNEIAQLRAALAKEYDQRIELMWERDAFKAALGKTVDHLRFNTWCEDPNNTRRIAAVNEARQVLEGVNDA
jgi:chromosome segregation ATPase